ncbi:MAG: hypothetical protein JWO82_236 [Akkermansiaceae bacterium]|nr:hypothetical protein [Akkermansiaceae bacterium]
MSSRRQRRRSAAAGTSSKRRWGTRILAGGLVAAVVIAGGGYLFLGRWLHGEGFRRTISESAGKATRTHAEFGIFEWSGSRLQTPSFSAVGDSLVKKVDAKALQVDIGLSAAWHGILQVDDAHLRSIDVELDSTAPAVKPISGELPGDEGKKKDARWYDRFIPHEIDLKKVEVDTSSLKVASKSGDIFSRGTAWRVEPGDQKGSYQARASGGKLTLPFKWAPPMELGVAMLKYSDDTLYLKDADFQVYQSGQLDLSGQMSLKGNGYHFDGDLRDVNCAEILEGDWKKRLAGTFKTSFAVGNPTGAPEVTGSLVLADAVLTALPLLDTLSAYADTARFRRISLQEASCGYAWEDGALRLSRVVLSSNGLIRLEGFLNVSKARQLDGVFRLGLAPGTLARIPGAETDVFLPGEKQLLWTALRISGTLDHPQEDLSERLVAAAGARMFEYIPETGEKVLKFTNDVIGEKLPDALRQGAEVVGPEAIERGKAALDQGKEVIRDAKGIANDVGDIFDVLRGREPPPAREPRKPKEGE